MTGRRRDDKERNDEEENYDGDSKKNEAGKITFRNAPEFRRDFIEFCLEEVNNAGQMGSALKIPSWERIGEKLSAKYGPMSNKKLRNHWDYLKKQYVAWSTLISMMGHDGYNAETNTFNWPKEQWDEISKKVKNASQFKEKGLEDAELLKSLFGGKILNGDNSLTMVERVERPRRGANVNVPMLASTSAPVDTVALEEPEPTRPIDRDPYFQDVSIEDTRDTSASPQLVKQRKRKKVEASSSDTISGKVDYLVEVIDKHFQQRQIALEKQQISLEKQQITLEKQQIAFEKQQSALEKKEDLAVRFIKTLEELKDAGHISFDDTLEVGIKVSELAGWQKLFVSLPTVEHRVSYVNKLLGRRRNLN